MTYRIFRLVIGLFLALAVMFAGVAPALAASIVLDTTFDTDGIVTTDFGYIHQIGYAIAIQGDGKMVVAGDARELNNPSNRDFALARYNSDGSLDSTFNTDGKVTTGITLDDSARAVAIQPDGKIVVAGDASNNRFALLRYNNDGSLDTTFDLDGKVTTKIGGGSLGHALALQSDGKLVVAGISSASGGWDIGLARYNSNGSLDISFDTDGVVTTDLGTNFDEGNAVTIQSDGKIIVAGHKNDGQDADFAVVRYNSNGSLDTTFDTDGIVTTPIGGSDEYGRAVALQSDSKIVVGGESFSSNSDNIDFALARYNTDGSLDTTFDTDGKLTTDFDNNSVDHGYAISIQSDGKIVVGGANAVTGRNQDFALARYNSNGSLDTTFDTDGKLTTDFDRDSIEFGYAIAIQSDGKIVAAGASNMASNEHFALVRYDVASSSTFKSVAINDGWILESLETSGTGGTMNKAATTFNLGDDAANKQYRAILSFNTSNLPDNAVIIKVTLKVKKNGVAGGGDPLSKFSGFNVDIKKGTFGTSPLELSDFQAAAGKIYGPFSPSLSSSGWYSINLTSGKGYINKMGSTQFRLRFNLEDNNNNIANFLKLYSGNATVVSDRPQLIIYYTIP